MTEIIVFLPGIMGSELRLGEKRVWPGPISSLVGKYELMDELLRPELVPSDIIRKYAISSQYGSLVKDLEVFGFKEGVTLFPFPYDWRKSNKEAASRLALRLDELTGQHAGAELTLLGHSMGGLVLRHYLESGLYCDRPGFKAVRRLITLATPHRGAPLALSAAVGKQKRLFLSEDQVLRLASDPRYPSLYELLPPEAEPFAYDGRFGQRLIPVDIYEKATSGSLGLVTSNLDAAKAFRRTLDLACRPNSVRYYFLYGTREATICATSIDLGAASPAKRVTDVEAEDAGDGTVPVWSGLVAGFQGRAVGGEHGTIYKNNTLRRTLASLLGYSGTLAAEELVEVSVRERVVEPGGLLHISFSLGAGVSELKGSLQLERADLDESGNLRRFNAVGSAQAVSYVGANVESIHVVRDGPDLSGLYRLTFVAPGGERLGFDEFFVQEPG